MKEAIENTWKAVMDNRHNPLRHLDLASQHYLMQVLGWMWSMVFRKAERMEEERLQPSRELSSASRCVWQLDREA